MVMNNKINPNAKLTLDKKNMHRKYSTKRITIITIITFVVFATLSHHLYGTAYQASPLATSHSLSSTSTTTDPPTFLASFPTLPQPAFPQLPTTNSTPSSPFSTVSVLIPDWEVLVIVTPKNSVLPTDKYTCVYPNKAATPARFSGELPFGRGTALKCEFPASNRRRLPFFQPQLVKDHEKRDDVNIINPPPLLLKWNFIVYDSFATENDVVFFVKGVNTRQGVNRLPSEFNCVFGDDVSTAVRTPVTSSIQEVFRCPRPELTGSRPISATVEIMERDRTVTVIPSLAKYVPDKARTVEFNEGKSHICACTMVYNVGKFLREWVMYHNNIGVDKFILYDNDSDDNLKGVVEELNREGYDVSTVYWVWPKTQEAGFSHSTLYSNRVCDWVAFIDVDEFIMSPKWLESARPRGNMLRSLLPKEGQEPDGLVQSNRVGQVSIKCNEFGPSNQTVHPAGGVTQGYTCRRRADQRHKSIVLLDALDHSLLNVVHHFRVKNGYRSSKVGMHDAIVNHYKYQAWPEFRAKFRRRVSAYVIDWRLNLNPRSNDRAPGLGFEAVEPPGWAQRFCEVEDDRLKVLTRRWFGLHETVMAWQSG